MLTQTSLTFHFLFPHHVLVRTEVERRSLWLQTGVPKGLSGKVTILTRKLSPITEYTLCCVTVKVYSDNYSMIELTLRENAGPSQPHHHHHSQSYHYSVSDSVRPQQINVK